MESNKLGKLHMLNKLNVDEVELVRSVPSPKTTTKIESANDTIKIYL